jgi:hypothetical protein
MIALYWIIHVTFPFVAGPRPGLLLVCLFKKGLAALKG